MCGDRCLESEIVKGLKPWRLELEFPSPKDTCDPETASPMNSPEAGSNEENPTYSQDGVDLTLIRWMLSLSPLERLETLQQTVQSILRLRREETEA
jgi:hypothetical protein